MGEARPRYGHAAQRDRGDRVERQRARGGVALPALVRTVERLLERGDSIEMVERMVAHWLRDHGDKENDLAQALRRSGLPKLGRGAAAFGARPERQAGRQADRESGDERDAQREQAQPPAPRATSRDGLFSEARAHCARMRLRPAAVFVVTERIDAWDADFRARGAWPVTGQVPLPPGFHLDAGQTIASWSTLTLEAIDRIRNGRAEDLWVVGAQEPQLAPDGAEARDHAQAYAETRDAR